MPLTSIFHRRTALPSEREVPQTLSSIYASKISAERGLPFLWSWAANANRSKLKGITLAHVLSGDTVSPISLSDFEAFLAFCDISLENLQFIVWYQDYRARYAALTPEQNVCIPTIMQAPVSPHSSSMTFGSSDLSQPNLRTSTSANGHFKREGRENDIAALSLDLRSFWISEGSSPPGPSKYDARESSSQVPYVQSSLDPSFQPSEKETRHTNDQLFHDEVQNILATFFVPGVRKELSLTSEMRESIIRKSSQTTHPDIFFPAYEAIYETVECVSLPRFLEHASTNINRPRQLLWYFSALPTFLLGVAIALLFILSSSEHLVVPPQSHRAWRLFSVPCFFLASLMWYKGFRGFCPPLFLRSSRQLRPWELERMINDKEAQAYCISLSKESTIRDKHVDGLPLTPVSAESSSSPIERIAPFLGEEDTDITRKEPGFQPDRIDASALRSTACCAPKERNHVNEQFRSRARKGFHRPPIFGPARVIEDKRIRAVHIHLLWSLIRFGLFWAVVSAAIVVSVPSLH